MHKISICRLVFILEILIESSFVSSEYFINEFCSNFQVAVTSQTYQPIFNELHARIKIPMVLIGDHTPFEAALCAECFFVTEFVASDTKINDLIGK